jgi:DeoR/GlpR family transcriptional regulator of sugar metabolism
MAYKNDDMLQNRRNYIVERVSKVRHYSNEIPKIANELYISERTVYRDLKDSGFFD